MRVKGPMSAASSRMRLSAHSITTRTAICPSSTPALNAKSPDRNSRQAGQSACEEHDGGGVEEGASRGEGCLRIFPEPPVSADPGEEPLNHPSSRVDGEADLIGGLSDDLDHY